MKRHILPLPAILIATFLFIGISQLTTDRAELTPFNVPHATVTAAHCDQDENCWFATWGGIGVYSRADESWTNFTPSNSGLGNTYCNDVTVDNDGLVWVAHHNQSGPQVSLLDHKGTLFDKSDDRWATFPGTDFSDGYGWTQTITVASDGRIWFGHGAGASVLDHKGTPFDREDDHWNHYSSADLGVRPGIVNAILEEGPGCMWIGSDGGLGRMCGFVPPLNNVPNCPNCCGPLWMGWVWDLALDQDGDLWVADGSCGAAEWNGSSWFFCDVHDPDCGLPPDDDEMDSGVRAVAVDGFNNVWFGTRGRGAARFDNFSDWSQFTTEDGWLGSDKIEDIDFDQRGDGWFATLGGNGVSVYRPASSSESKITPNEGGEIISPDSRAKASFAAGSVVVTTTVTIELKGSFPTGDYFATYAFDLSTSPAYTSTVPYTLTILYTEPSLLPLNEESVGLYWQNGDEWTKELTSIVDTEHNRVTASPNHMTVFALLGEAEHIYLPLLLK